MSSHRKYSDFVITQPGNLMGPIGESFYMNPAEASSTQSETTGKIKEEEKTLTNLTALNTEVKKKKL